MIEIQNKQRLELDIIINQELISTVYQPIVSLKDGTILGYEALSRIKLEDCSFNVEQMFHLAKEHGKLWELEELCRKKSLQNAKDKRLDAKIFLNVDPNIIHDKAFKSGMTIEYLKQYHLKPEDIVFEITERSAICDINTFQGAMEHYKEQTFSTAIDDFGDGYAGLNRICVFSPDYIKFDRMVVHNIHLDQKKRAIVKSCIQFCKSEGIKSVAEGIENKEELKTLIKIGLDYGQGYYIQRPMDEKYDIKPEIKQEITSLYNDNHNFKYKASFFGKVGTIARRKKTVYLKEPALKVFENMERNANVTETFVLDDKDCVCGILTRSKLLEAFGGRYGYNLHIRKTAQEMMDSNFLIVDENVSLETVSKMALARNIESIYDAVVITSKEKYKGVVTVKDLLETAITIQITKAMDTNPLTGLPGNSIIQKEIEETMRSAKKYAVIYFDLDNFKAYNDAYGFHNGDLMLKTMALVMSSIAKEKFFVGHVGGDDFVMIAGTWELEGICEEIMDVFHEKIRNLYSKQDWEKGCILSKNRNGFQEIFPIVTISAAIITNERKQIYSMDQLSKELATVKKQAKQSVGNSICKV